MNNEPRTAAVKRVGRAESGHVISGFFVFCLIAMFALLATTLVLVGIRAYRSVNDRSVRNSEGQIAISYLINKLHTYDARDKVTLSDGGDRLCLRETYDDVVYETRIYCDGEALREYFCEAEEPFDAEMGETVTHLTSIHATFVEPWLIRLELTQTNGETYSAHVALRAEEANAP